jgi:hypothetical protein
MTTRPNAVILDVMKKLIFSGLLALALARSASAQPSQTWINNGTIITNIPPQIDALNVINNGIFQVSLNGSTSIVSSLIGTLVLNPVIEPYQFSDMLTFTNRGLIASDNGFIFNNAPSGFGVAQRSATFGNANVGSISGGSFSNAFFTSAVIFAGLGVSVNTAVPLVTVSATNVVNTGTLDVGLNGVLTVDGESLNLSRGTMKVESFDDFVDASAFAGFLFSPGFVLSGASFNIGIFGNYWGIGNQTNLISFQNVQLPSPFGPSSAVVNSTFNPGLQSVFLNNALAFANAFEINASNFTFQVVFVNTNVGISTQCRFVPAADFSVPTIQWEAVITNNQGLPPITNDLYLSDYYGAIETNLLVTNNFSINGVPAPSPFNFVFTRQFLGYSNNPVGNIAYTPANATNIFLRTGAFPATNVYAAYGVSLGAVTSLPDPSLPGSTITNTAGRIIVNADKYLDLTRTVINGPNYLSIAATNHFAGSSNATIISPFMDVNVGTTNGSLVITNLVAPYVPRFVGPIDMYAARWTNIVNGITNRFHVLIVNPQLAPVSPPLVLNCALRSTNVVVSDALNINNSLLVNAQSLTIVTNDPFSPTYIGAINIQNPDIFWSSSLPTLQYFTNWGLVTVPNTTYFAGVRTTPYYTTNFTEPYQAFVNHGSIITSGNTVWANYFENKGAGAIITNNLSAAATNTTLNVTTNSALLFSSAGPISVQANTAVLANGMFSAVTIGDISITAGSLSISNHVLAASGALSFAATNLFTDTGVASSNFWTAGDGINLFAKPAAGDLLGTTISCTAPVNLEVPSVWAGEDRGASAAGFSNDAAIGHLILNGVGNASGFFFTGTNAAAHNAMYVDLLELQGTAGTNTLQGGELVFSALDIDPSMTIYFADAVANGLDVSEKLNGSSGGRAVWVPGYAGLFSGTNITYPSGRTYRFNRGLVLSQDIDSDGDGIVNAFDPTPIFTADNVGLALTITNLPPKTAKITWHTLANSTNSLFYNNSLASTNWLVLTNFVQGPANGVVTISDPVQGGTRYYKVQVDAPQP